MSKVRQTIQRIGASESHSRRTTHLSDKFMIGEDDAPRTAQSVVGSEMNSGAASTGNRPKHAGSRFFVVLI